MAFDINIVSTGSIGNLNIIDKNIVIDIGVTRKLLLEHQPENIEYIFISHEHGDHLGIAPLNWFAKNRPWIIRKGLYINQGTYTKICHKAPKVAELIDPDHIIGDDENFTIETSTGHYTVRTYPLDHDVEIQGFIIENEDGDKLIHATDTTTMAMAPDEKFNYFLVEGNWDEDRQYEALMAELDQALDTLDEPDGAMPRLRATENWRHLSIQACTEFVHSHAMPGSKVWQLHESSDFGYRVDLSLGAEDGLIESMRHAVKNDTND